MGKHYTAWERSEIERMKAEGITHREIGEQLGYSRIQIKEYFRRIYEKERMAKKGEIPNSKGRPRKKAITAQQECERRIKELERENELLRSFLHAAGRRCVQK